MSSSRYYAGYPTRSVSLTTVPPHRGGKTEIDLRVVKSLRLLIISAVHHLHPTQKAKIRIILSVIISPAYSTQTFILDITSKHRRAI